MQPPTLFLDFAQVYAVEPMPILGVDAEDGGGRDDHDGARHVQNQLGLVHTYVESLSFHGADSYVACEQYENEEDHVDPELAVRDNLLVGKTLFGGGPGTGEFVDADHELVEEDADAYEHEVHVDETKVGTTGPAERGEPQSRGNPCYLSRRNVSVLQPARDSAGTEPLSQSCSCSSCSTKESLGCQLSCKRGLC